MKIGFYDESAIWMYSIWDTAYAVLIRSLKNAKIYAFPAVLNQSEYRLIRDASAVQNGQNPIYDLLFSFLSDYHISINRVELFQDSAGGMRSRLIMRQHGKKRELIAGIADGLYFFVRTRCRLTVERRIYDEHGLTFNQALLIAHNNMRRELEEALLQENYELAAEIRDQLAKIK